MNPFVILLGGQGCAVGSRDLLNIITRHCLSVITKEAHLKIQKFKKYMHALMMGRSITIQLYLRM